MNILKKHIKVRKEKKKKRKKKRKRERKRERVYNKIRSFLFYLFRFILVVSIIGTLVVVGVRYIGVDWFKDVFNSLVRVFDGLVVIYDATPWYVLILGLIMITYLLKIIGITEVDNEEYDFETIIARHQKKIDDNYGVKKFKEPIDKEILSKDDQKKLEKILNNFRKMYGKYPVDMSTIFLKHPKWNLVIPEQREKLKDSYYKFTIVSHNDFKDWLNDGNLDYLEGEQSYIPPDIDTLSLMKDAFKDDYHYTENTIYLKFNPEEMMLYEIEELKFDTPSGRIVKKEEFQKWLDS